MNVNVSEIRSQLFFLKKLIETKGKIDPEDRKKIKSLVDLFWEKDINENIYKLFLNNVKNRKISEQFEMYKKIPYFNKQIDDFSVNIHRFLNNKMNSNIPTKIRIILFSIILVGVGLTFGQMCIENIKVRLKGPNLTIGDFLKSIFLNLDNLIDGILFLIGVLLIVFGFLIVYYMNAFFSDPNENMLRVISFLEKFVFIEEVSKDIEKKSSVKRLTLYTHLKKTLEDIVKKNKRKWWDFFDKDLKEQLKRTIKEEVEIGIKDIKHPLIDNRKTKMDVFYSGYEFIITIKIFNKNNIALVDNEIVRTLYLNTSNKKWEIHNDLLQVKDEFQGQGIAKEIYRVLSNVFEKIQDTKEIHILAAWDGRFVWSRIKDCRFADSETKRDILEGYKEWCEEFGQEYRPLKNPIDFPRRYLLSDDYAPWAIEYIVPLRATFIKKWGL